jgi:hypothetical protein
MPPPADARAGRIAFTHPDFVLFQIARFLIVAAVEMQAVAVGWQVYDITKRALDLGLVGLAQFLPGILLFLVSGTRRIDSTGARCWVLAMRVLHFAPGFCWCWRSGARTRCVPFMLC